jgi:hypothetical protein
VKALRAILRWTGRIFLVLLVIFVGFILEENIRGRILLARCKAELRAKGEKLTLAELNLPKVPQEGNGAPAMIEAASQLAPYSKKSPYLIFAFAMKPIAPGRAEVFSRESEPSPRRPSYTWDDLSKEVSVVSDILDEARMASRQPMLAAILDYTKGLRSQSLHSSDLFHLGSWLAAAAINALHEGNLDEALENIVAIGKLVQVQKYERIAALQNVRLMTAGYGLSVTWQALQSDDWTDRQLTRLQECWEQAECLPDLVPTMEVRESQVPARRSSTCTSGPA